MAKSNEKLDLVLNELNPNENETMTLEELENEIEKMEDFKDNNKSNELEEETEEQKEKAFKSAKKFKFTRDIKSGDNGEDVEKLQRLLGIEPTGFVDVETNNAIFDKRVEFGIDAITVADEKLYKLLQE